MKVVGNGGMPEDFEQELQDEMVFRLEQVLTTEQSGDPMWSEESSMHMSWFYAEE